MIHRIREAHVSQKNSMNTFRSKKHFEIAGIGMFFGEVRHVEAGDGYFGSQNRDLRSSANNLVGCFFIPDATVGVLSLNVDFGLIFVGLKNQDMGGGDVQ